MAADSPLPQFTPEMMEGFNTALLNASTFGSGFFQITPNRARYLDSAEFSRWYRAIETIKAQPFF